MVGSNHRWLEGASETHFCGNVGGECGEGSGCDGSSGPMAWEEATVSRAGVDDPTIIVEAVEETLGQGPGEIHVEDSGRGRLVGRVV